MTSQPASIPTWHPPGHEWPGFQLLCDLGRPCMLRFTLHRTSQNSAVSTCCHDMSCRDVSGRVHVGVRPVPTGHAHEARLALATLGCDVLAGVRSATCTQLLLSRPDRAPS